MAWTTPRTWVALEYLTASIFNTHVRDQLNELRAGGFALASQAAGDYMIATSATQWGRRSGENQMLRNYIFDMGD